MAELRPRRLCPTCALRYAGHVDPGCVVCQGLGYLLLGDWALQREPAPLVCRAVEFYLDSFPDRDDLRGAVDALVQKGILAREDPALLSTITSLPQPEPSTADRTAMGRRAARLAAVMSGSSTHPSERVQQPKAPPGVVDELALRRMRLEGQ